MRLPVSQSLLFFPLGTKIFSLFLNDVEEKNITILNKIMINENTAQHYKRILSMLFLTPILLLLFIYIRDLKK